MVAFTFFIFCNKCQFAWCTSIKFDELLVVLVYNKINAQKHCCSRFFIVNSFKFKNLLTQSFIMEHIKIKAKANECF